MRRLVAMGLLAEQPVKVGGRPATAYVPCAPVPASGLAHVLSR
jgi:uncharacterized membrane protein